MSAFNARFGKFGVGMMILQAAKTGFFKIMRRFRWRGVGLDG
jgi:hypothetical protein